MTRPAAAPDPPADLTEQYLRVPIGQLAPSRTNPRTHFDDGYLAELAGSIAEKGVVQPILVRPRPGGDRFEIVAGECRYRASLLAKQATIPAVIRAYTDEQVLELQLVENLHRKDLTALEQARGYRALIDANPTKHSAESIAARIGMSPQWVWDRMKLNDLVPEAKKILEQDRMTVGHAILIARLKPEDQARAIHPGSGDYSDRDQGGLWTEDAARFDELDEADGKPAGKYDGLKARSIRELETWINDHIRFDVAHAAKAAPLQFEDLAAKVEQVTAAPGRGRKVIAITFDHFTQPEARDEKERTYGPRSWKRADGTKKTTVTDYPRRVLDSPPCEFAVLGVVAAGERRGEAFDVCIARDKCDVHWKREKGEREKNARLRTSGKSQQAKAREAARDRREEEARKRRDDRFKQFRPALEKAVRAAVDKLPVGLPPAVFTRMLVAHHLPAKTKPAQLQKVLLLDAIDDTFRSSWHGDETHMVAWAKLLGVDVKACEPKATVQTSGVKDKKRAKGKSA